MIEVDKEEKVLWFMMSRRYFEERGPGAPAGILNCFVQSMCLLTCEIPFPPAACGGGGGGAEGEGEGTGELEFRE